MSVISLLTIIIVLIIGLNSGQTYDNQRKTGDNELEHMILETMKVMDISEDSEDINLKLKLLSTVAILVLSVIIGVIVWLYFNCVNKINKKLDFLNHKLLIQQKLNAYQRRQTDYLKNTVIPEIKGKLQAEARLIEELNTQINNSKSNPVPIGFIYVQLSGQSDPNTLWPNTEWQNISDEYSGLFFRAEGGQSSTFGETQEQQTQSLEIYNGYPNGDEVTWKEWVEIRESESDKFVYTGHLGGGDQRGIKLKHNIEEIRARNQAVRIWQRIK